MKPLLHTNSSHASSPFQAHPTTRAELTSWYLYDWANSVFSSAALVMWLPIFLMDLATQHACPYTYLEVRPSSLRRRATTVIYN
jgi:MFS-type transporter involved in bile tolerance (Atg22 family)